MPPSNSLPRQLRIRKSYDFKELRSDGQRFHTDYFVLQHRKNELGVGRLGMSVSRRAGNAVRRNGIKRQIRTFFRLNRAHFNSMDLHFIVKTKPVSQQATEKKLTFRADFEKVKKYLQNQR